MILDRLAVTPALMRSIDNAECIEGYWDGRRNDPEAGANRSASYVQGWWAGMRDGGHREYHPVDEQIVAARKAAWKEMDI